MGTFIKIRGDGFASRAFRIDLSSPFNIKQQLFEVAIFYKKNCNIIYNPVWIVLLVSLHDHCALKAECSDVSENFARAG